MLYRRRNVFKLYSLDLTVSSELLPVTVLDREFQPSRWKEQKSGIVQKMCPCVNSKWRNTAWCLTELLVAFL